MNLSIRVIYACSKNGTIMRLTNSDRTVGTKNYTHRIFNKFYVTTVVRTKIPKNLSAKFTIRFITFIINSQSMIERNITTNILNINNERVIS